LAEKKVLSYRDLEIWKLARELAVGVHKQYNLLGRRINTFLQTVVRDHLLPNDFVNQQIPNDGT
jgi:hypothetical protein